LGEFSTRKETKGFTGFFKKQVGTLEKIGARLGFISLMSVSLLPVNERGEIQKLQGEKIGSGGPHLCGDWLTGNL